MWGVQKCSNAEWVGWYFGRVVGWHRVVHSKGEGHVGQQHHRFRRLAVVGGFALVATAGIAFGSGGNAAAVALDACFPTVSSADGDTVLSFTTTGACSWLVPAGVTALDILVVGGGGSGGRSDERSVGGGGGGGVAVGTDVELSGEVAIVVGVGGVTLDGCGPWPETVNGSPSSISNAPFVAAGSEVEIVADGGGHGGGCSENTIAAGGGSGGGGHSDWVPYGGPASQGSTLNIDGVTLYGNDGGDGSASDGLSGGGGGGATAAGSDGAAGAGGDGGEGLSIDITGTAVVYGSGGGGIGTVSDGAGGTNAGDGVPNVAPTDASAYDGVANTGGGGGGAFNAAPGSGGSGVVVIRYAPPRIPTIGSSTWSLLLWASALAVVGGGLVLVRRRPAVSDVRR